MHACRYLRPDILLLPELHALFFILPAHLARYYLLHVPTSLLPYASASNERSSLAQKGRDFFFHEHLIFTQFLRFAVMVSIQIGRFLS